MFAFEPSDTEHAAPCTVDIIVVARQRNISMRQVTRVEPTQDWDMDGGCKVQQVVASGCPFFEQIRNHRKSSNVLKCNNFELLTKHVQIIHCKSCFKIHELQPIRFTGYPYKIYENIFCTKYVCAKPTILCNADTNFDAQHTTGFPNQSTQKQNCPLHYLD